MFSANIYPPLSDHWKLGMPTLYTWGSLCLLPPLSATLYFISVVLPIGFGVLLNSKYHERSSHIFKITPKLGRIFIHCLHYQDYPKGGHTYHSSSPLPDSYLLQLPRCVYRPWNGEQGLIGVMDSENWYNNIINNYSFTLPGAKCLDTRKKTSLKFRS